MACRSLQTPSGFILLEGWIGKGHRDQTSSLSYETSSLQGQRSWDWAQGQIALLGPW